MNGYSYIEFAPTDRGAVLHMARRDTVGAFDIETLNVEATVVFCKLVDDGAARGDLLIIPRYYGFNVWLTGHGGHVRGPA